MNQSTILAALAGAVTVWSGTGAGAQPTSLEAFLALPRPEPTLELRYGPAPAQGIDVFLPSGKPPFPIAILIHGGCWRNLPGAGREQLRHLGAELASGGIAVWSIGYRRADERGGGYPGTFLDVGEAIDRLRSDAARYHFDLTRTVLVGHSAGGHLALWAAVRDRLPPGPLRRTDPFVPRAVVSVAGIGDLEAFSPLIPSHCGPGILERLLPSLPSANPYAEISPAALPPPSGSVVMISGSLDGLVPPRAARDYARAIEPKRSMAVEIVDIDGASHFDLVTPGTHAWFAVRAAIDRALGVVPDIAGD